MENKLSKYFKKHKLKPTPWGVKHGISPATLSRFLRGKSTLTPANAKRISKATLGKVSVLDLLYPR